MRHAREVAHLLPLEREPEQPQIHHEHRAADDGQRQQVHGFDDGKRPERFVDRDAQAGTLEPLKDCKVTMYLPTSRGERTSCRR
jgi:hypothetical protein